MKPGWMFLVTTTHTGSVSAAFSALPEAAAASEQRLWCPQHSAGFAEERSQLNAGDALVQVQLFLNPSGLSGLAPVHFLFVCLFISFGG